MGAAATVAAGVAVTVAVAAAATAAVAEAFAAIAVRVRFHERSTGRNHGGRGNQVGRGGPDLVVSF